MTSNGWKRILNKLKRYGVSGILSYGVLNTAYYLTTFLLVWFYVAPAPWRMGYFATVERFFEVMEMVWAGSQLTKLIRLEGLWHLHHLYIEDYRGLLSSSVLSPKGRHLQPIVGICFALAFMMFVVVTLVSA